MLSAISSAIGGAADAVHGAVTGAGRDAMLILAEQEVEKQVGRKIEISCSDIPASWNTWIMMTGVNSLCNDSTWAFLENSPYNQRKLELWNKRNIQKIVMRVDEHPDPDLADWAVCMPSWTEGSDTLTLTWLPRAYHWSSSVPWNGSGYKCWWILCDEIVFGLQLYQLPGKCFYKSDWFDGFEDVDPDGLFPTATKKCRRWFQHRHWVLFWYENAQWGYNWQWTTSPPPLPDGSIFNLDAILSMPSMPSLKMPSVKLPSLPDVSLPSLPSLSAPSLSLPSLSAPSLSAPSIDLSKVSLPGIPERKMRPKNKWACHGLIEMTDLKVKAKGNELVLSNATITHFWEDKAGNYDDEKKEHQKLVLTTTTPEQALSWQETLVASGAEEGEVGCCCTVA